MAAPIDYQKSVFINCPFDGSYKPIFEAVVFAVYDCGFRPRCALEIEDGGQVRMDKIFDMIADCKLGINDLSRVDLDSATGLPRFNMPLELGIFLAARRYGQGHQREKVCLILDREKYRYRAFISDISGQDIREHGDDPLVAIRVVRNWLRNHSGSLAMPGGKAIWERYKLFLDELPELCQEARLDQQELIFVDYVDLVVKWLRRKA